MIVSAMKKHQLERGNMMLMYDACPACGSKKVLIEKQETINVPIPYGKPAFFTNKYYHCSVCLTDLAGNFGDEISSKIIHKAVIKSVSAMLDDLHEMGVSSVYFERALRLPLNTTEKWRAGSITEDEVALLRIIRTYPWMLEIADNNFDKNEAMKEAYKQLLKPK